MSVTATQAAVAAAVAGPATGYLLGRVTGPLIAIPAGVAASYLTLRLLRPDLLELAMQAAHISNALAEPLRRLGV